ncbi:MAG: FAD-dependent oxidoreductase, partial [Rhodanobacter sp.]
MANTIEIKVPDIGGHSKVPVIEVLVKAGDTVEKEQGLATLESDKATMEIPASAAGKVREVRVKVGDEVDEGTVIALLEVAEGEASSSGQADAVDKAVAAVPPAPSESKPSGVGTASSPAPSAEASSGRKPDIECRLVVLGSGPGGYSAAFRAADLGIDTVLVERYGTLGGVCLNVGCIPSKALLHAAEVIDEAAGMAAHGVSFGKPKIELDKLREFKSGVVAKLTGGLAAMARQRKVRTLEGDGRFVSPHEMEVQGKDGVKLIRFDHAIIAAGSQSVKLPIFPWDDPRVVDSTGALELPEVPKKLLVVGGGIIGLEMATVYAA